MIVLDTNVVSEAIKPEGHPAVIEWLNGQSAETLFITSVTAAELLFGVEVLPDGRKKVLLSKSVARGLAIFEGRILEFDLTAARHYATLAVSARSRGRGFPVSDGYIAAIAASRGFAVATRDTSAYHAAGLTVINPFE
jgi:toxin FitB